MEAPSEPHLAGADLTHRTNALCLWASREVAPTCDEVALAGKNDEIRSPRIGYVDDGSHRMYGYKFAKHVKDII